MPYKNISLRRINPHRLSNVHFYSLKEIFERKFKESVDYENEKKELIWSVESRNHPDFGRVIDNVGGINDRISQNSLYATFFILGSVILFIIIIYFYQELSVKKLIQKQQRKEKIRNLMQTRIFYLEQSGQLNMRCETMDMLERKNSLLLETFRHFRL